MSRTRSNYYDIVKSRYENKFSTFLAEMIFDDEYDLNSDTHKELLISYRRHVLPIPLKREVFTRVLLELDENLIGQGSDRLRVLYFSLNMERFAYKQLHSSRWDTKIIGIRTLAQMDIKEAFKDILKYNNSKNVLLRAEAQYACVKLVGVSAIKLITETHQQISEWQQIQILEFIKKKETIKIPDFAYLLSSNNDSVVLFGIKLVSYFKQMNADTNLLLLMYHANESIVEKSIECLSVLEVKNISRYLKQRYWSAHYNARLEILKAIGNIGENSDIDFLRKAFREDYHDLKLFAAKSMRKVSKQGGKILEYMKDYSNEQELAVIEHCFDDRI